MRWDGGPGGGWGGAGLTGSASSSVVRDAWFFGHDVVEVGERRGLGRDPRTVRLHPYLSRLVEQVGADPARLRAMAAEARERAATLVAAGANPRVGELSDMCVARPCSKRPPRRCRPHPRRRGTGRRTRDRCGASASTGGGATARRRPAGRSTTWPGGRGTSPPSRSCSTAPRWARSGSRSAPGAGWRRSRASRWPRTSAGSAWAPGWSRPPCAPRRRARLPVAHRRRAGGRAGFWRAMAKRFQFEPSHVDHVPCAHMAGPGPAAGCAADQAGR